MTMRRAGFRVLSILCREFVRLRFPHPTDRHGSKHRGPGEGRFVLFRVVSQLEQERRVLQEGLNSAQRAVDQTLILIKEALAARAKDHVRAMLFRRKAHAQKPSQKAA
jgi:hypothetical protein